MTDSTIYILDPQIVWKHIAELCAFPNTLLLENRLGDHIVEFAKSLGLEYKVDDAGNVLISKPATDGMANRQGVVLHTHLDLAAKELEKRLGPQGVEIKFDDSWLMTENGAILGSDNAMGIAVALAVLESNDVAHGPIEALFTVSDNTDMYGVHRLQKDFIKGDILIDLDHQTEGVFCIGCAGGVELTAKFKYYEDRNHYFDRKAVRIEVRGLKGGHSGLDIDKYGANANKLLFRFLYLGMRYFDLNIGWVDGGSDDINEIPSEATAVVCISGKSAEDFIYGLEQYEQIIKDEYRDTEENISIKAYYCDMPEYVWDRKSVEQVICAVCGCPNGVRKMSSVIQGVVRTSANIARVYSKDGEVTVRSLLRSFSKTEKEAFANDLTTVFELAGARVSLSGDYEGWRSEMDSPILRVMSDTYLGLYGIRPDITAIHAGLETGVMRGIYPNLDIISCGPTIENAHTAQERIDIDSVGRFWRLLCYTLGNIPVK